jgi:hypothetical protein
MKKIILILLFNSLLGYAQCDYKVNNRPDGNVIKYFNPKPVIRQSNYEVGAATYFNLTTKKYYINLTVLLKNINIDSVEDNLNIQLKNSTQSISLELIQFNKTQMNNRDVMIALYEIDSRSLDLLKKYSLKTLFFTMQSKTYGSTINENNNLFINQLKCF